MLTPASKKKLSETIRGLRARLITELRDEAAARYRLSVPADAAKLSEAARMRRARLDRWLDERARAQGVAPDPVARWSDTDDLLAPKTPWRKARRRFLEEAATLAAATFLNRLVVLRCMEAAGLVKPPVLTGGLDSKAVRELREFAPALFADENAGFAWLLGQVFDELARDLPGLFGDVGLTALFEPSAGTLRATVDALDDKDLADAWDDDTTLGWTYQYWNDPQREALDAKINDGGKIEGHEIAAKTQMFTERYMVEWLLQNSLGLQWLALCCKNGWVADAEEPVATGEETDGVAVRESVLDRLEKRRVAWRAKREAGEVALDALMPYTVGDLEERWRYFVPQEIPDDLVKAVPASLRELRVLDPACGSGHFLVIAFGLLAHLYEEEARHRGVAWSKPDIARWILEDNLHGIDLDPRAVQIAAAALHLAARQYAGSPVTPRRMNLVATAFDLARLGANDPAVVALRESLAREAGVPPESVARIITMLAGIDTFGSLVKLDKALDEAVAEAEKERKAQAQGELFNAGALKVAAAQEPPRALVERIERFLGEHTHAEDLGVRLDGEQLAAGVRFARMVREGQYHLVVGNPPYQGVGKLVDGSALVRAYPDGKTDLFAMFYLRALELLRPEGLVGMVTLSNWMYLGTFEGLRGRLLARHIRLIADFGKAAFTTGGTLISTSATLIANREPVEHSTALRPHSSEEIVRDDGQPNRTHAALLLQRGRHEFATPSFGVIEGRPIVYWWSKESLESYERHPKLGDVSEVRTGLCTSDNTRYLRSRWELGPALDQWAPFVSGAGGLAWIEPCDERCRWGILGLDMKVFNEHLYGSYSRTVQNERYYFRRGVAYTSIGSTFRARAYRVAAVMGKMGSSVFPEDVALTTCSMNASRVREVLSSINPGLHFEVGDVNRLPLFPVESANEIFATIERAFSEHEAARETSVEFRRPAPSPWTYAQAWAQRAVDRPAGAPLPPYEPTYDPVEPVAHLSFALGVALGRFDAAGAGLLDAAPPSSLPAGILFLSGARDADGLTHPACAGLHAAWAEHGASIAAGSDLRTYLRRDFFDEHRTRYDNRPIWWPLSSAKRTFVAWVAIHRWTHATLTELLADHLLPEKRALEGELEDLRRARHEGEKGARAKAERRYAEVQKQHEELEAFVAAVQQCAERGPAPTDEKCPARERDAPYAMDLDDGVMVNASALWPLLDPQWKDPRKWWKELCAAEGRKDYDWSHLAARYFPTRVAEKCKDDPSLAVAHGCFWRLHPARAFAWELRLGMEIRPDFTIDEADSDACRARWFEAETKAALEAVEKELTRRNRKRRGAEAKGDDAEEDDAGGAKEVPPTLRVAKGALWARAPGEVFALELRWRAVLGEAFAVEEPGHEERRARWEAEHAEEAGALRKRAVAQGALALGAEGKRGKGKRSARVSRDTDN
ncbi:MAG: BREX-6 system adenine-specific DNA-methyltransferase PglX [Polyangiales bacterium]